MLGLPRYRDAQIEGGAQRHAHGRGFLVRSSALREKLVEQVSEPPLEHVDLGIRDGNALRPIVGDGPRGKIVLGWAAWKRPWRAENLVKLVRYRKLMRARGTGRSARVAGALVAYNRPSLRRDPPRPAAWEYKGSAAPGCPGVGVAGIRRQS